MHRYAKYFFFLLILITAVSCKKDDSPTESTVEKKTAILTSTTWEIASDSQTGTAGAELTFSEDGTLKTTYGSTTISSTWTLNTDETEIEITTTAYGMTIVVPYKISSCTSDQIILIINNTSDEDYGKNLKLVKAS